MNTTARTARIAVALDTSDWDEFCLWCRRFGPRVGVLKVGLEAFVRWGPAAVDEARNHGGRIFLDLKLHDIPNTVAGAVASARDLGADYLTVHAGGGARMLEAASEAAEDRVNILAVTVLTHMDSRSLGELGLTTDPERLAASWAQLAAQSGCAGAVCSPLEAAGLRRRLPEPFLLVTPGIRSSSRVAADDQRRTATVAEALDAGANLLVVGRPLTRAEDPDAALEELLAGS